MSIYSYPEVYDVAFSYRDIPREVDVLLSWYGRWNQRGSELPSNVLELASGPGAHAVECASRKILATAVDSSVEMAAYARRKAAEAEVHLNVVSCDMRRLHLECKYDLALLMLDSGSHILSFAGMVEHLRSVAIHLNVGGVYILEFAFPNPHGHHQKTKDKWYVERDGINVEVKWLSKRTRRAVRKPHYISEVHISGFAGERRIQIVEQLRLRSWSSRLFEKAIYRSQCFHVAAKQGGFRPNYTFDEKSWRMIYILTRNSHSVSTK